jgi:TolA-binding protein
VSRRVLPLAGLWIALVAATPQPVPVELPAPDFIKLIPLAAAPIDKPPVPAPDLALPDGPQLMPDLPPPALFIEKIPPKPVGPSPPMTCDRWVRLGEVESMNDCGIARFQAGELKRAVEMFEGVLRRGPSRYDARRARYWLGETYYRLDRFAEADRLFVTVSQETLGDPLKAHALLSGGWTALQLGDATRALDVFDSVLRPAPLAPESVLASARRGQALAFSMLGRQEEARAAWSALTGSSVQATEREAQFWLAESLGRLGKYDAAEAQLVRFINGGAHPLLDTATLRLAWWRDKGGRPAEAVATYRQLLGKTGLLPEREWVHLALVQALLNADDPAGAREAMRWLQDKSSPLLKPALFALARWTVAKRPAEARRVNQELLARGLSGSERAWVLCLEGESLWHQGEKDEARTRYELAQTSDPSGTTGAFASLRLAQINFDFREFVQAQQDLKTLLAGPITGENRAAALLLAGEVAYYAGDYEASVGLFRTFLGEFPRHAAVPSARMSVAWGELRRANDAEARKLFEEFASERPDSPHAPDALVLAAELAAKSGDTARALDLLTRMTGQYAGHPRTDIARLNIAILQLRTGRIGDAQATLQELVSSAGASPLIGRAHAALGIARLQAKLPSEARTEFITARNEIGGGLVRLGLGAAAMALKQWDEAATALKEAKELGSVQVGDAADYLLAKLAFERGQREEFKKAAASLVTAGRAPASVQYGLVVLAIGDRAWDEAVAAARRLLTEHPKDPTADSALARLGQAAAADKRWKVAQEAFTLLRTQYPQSPFVEATFEQALDAQIEGGGYAAARDMLEDLVKTAPSGPRATRAWFLLARAREEAGDRPGAIEAYGRAGRDGQGPEWTTDVRLRYSRLLLEDKRWQEARAAVGPVVNNADPAVATEAAFYEGESYRGEGNASAAVLAYMNAAYLSPESPFGRRALLMAGESYVVLRQPDSAVIAYNKLLAQPNLPPEIAQRARTRLADLADGQLTNGSR